MRNNLLSSILLSLLLLPSLAFAGYHVQQGATTINNSTTVLDVPLTTNVSSLNRAFVMIHYSYGHTPGANTGVNADDGMVSAYLWDNAGTSTIRLTRDGNAVSVAVSWTVIECTNAEFAVYRGTQAWSGTTTTYSPTIGGSVVGENCFAWVNGTTTNNTGTTAIRETYFTADVSTGNQTTLNLRRFQVTATPSGTLRWIVVEFDPAKIGGLDTGEQTLTTEQENSRASWGIAGCTKSQSLLIGQWRVNGDDGLNAHAMAINLVNDTTGEAYVHLNANYERILRWYCIDFGSNVGSRQEGQVDNSANSAWTTATQTLTPAVDPAQTVSFVTMTSNGNGTAFPRPTLRHWVSGSSTLEIERDYSGQGSWIEWQTLELPVPQTNQIPTLTGGATQATPPAVNRLGANTTTLAAQFSDADDPGIGAFTVTLRVREPDNTTEITLVNALTNGNGGLSVTSQGGGNYTASYDWDPGTLQTLGLYDLYFEVSDGTDSAVDDFTNNLDELEIIEANPPTVAAGTTAASLSPVNRYSTNTTTLSAQFSDADDPGVGAFTVTFKVREPDNATEVVLVNALTTGNGGLAITSQGGGNYTASYTWDPGSLQTLGLYDLYFEVSDGLETAIDTYASNADEIEITDVIPPLSPTAAISAVKANPTSVNRLNANTTQISADFHDDNRPGASSFLITLKVREPDNLTEVILVNGLSHGAGGLTVSDLGNGDYRAQYSYDPLDSQALGFYDLYFAVDDNTGMAPAIDPFNDNLNELVLNEIIINNAPSLAAGATTVIPVSLDRFGAGTTSFSIDFSDTDQPGVGAFAVTIRARSPFGSPVYTIADSLVNGQSGLAISDNGGGSYTASILWDPPDNTVLGAYDLYCEVSDGLDVGVDGYANNLDELTITNGGENAPPIVAGDAVSASPPGVERIGANTTTISAQFQDSDDPGVSAFVVSFKLRLPNNTTEITLAGAAGNGQSGVSIVADGGGLYTASITWNPPDAQTLGFYDLYFDVFEGVDGSIDGYANNLDELQIYDAISNNSPTVVSGAIFALPTSINRIGLDYTMLKAAFSDIDVPGIGAFRVTMKLWSPLGVETIVVNNALNGQQGLRITHTGGANYEASVLWDPATGTETGTYDLYFSVSDPDGATATDGYAANLSELTVTSSTPLGDGLLLHRTNDSATCGGANSACHDIANHQSFNCLDCHTPHNTANIYLVKETIQTPNSGAKTVLFKTLGQGDPYNTPDPTTGDPNSGTMADATDGVFTNVCEVCHTTTTHHRNNASTPLPDHNNAANCIQCHDHGGGFSGGESTGGAGCTCHTEIIAGMQGVTGYHHTLTSTDPDYAAGSRTCLQCHVDHDIFRPDLNPGEGSRGANLRSDIAISVIQNDPTVLANSDYLSGGSGGICLSCHNNGTQGAPLISQSGFTGASSAHNYSTTATFATDGSTFLANCTKCHNDTMTKSFQNSTDTFGLHNSDYSVLQAPLGIGTPADPLEEEFCYECHSPANPNSGSNQDYYGVKGMASGGPLNIDNDIALSSNHPVGSTKGTHQPGEDPALMARHVECSDCHNPHESTAARPASPALVGALFGVDGIDITANPVSSVTYEYEVCFKCHSDRPDSTPPVNRRWPNMNTQDEFKPTSLSFHPVAAQGKNPDSPSLIPPWTETSIMLCGDCHAASGGQARGPHGSQWSPILRLRYTRVDPNPESATEYALCYDCHDRNSILADDSFKEHDKHIRGEDAACYVCHDAHGVAATGAGDGSHLINFATDVVTSSGNRLEWIDDGNFKGTCWLTCHLKDHDGFSY